MYFGSGGSLIQNDHPQTDALRGGPRNSSGGGGGGGVLGRNSSGGGAVRVQVRGNFQILASFPVPMCTAKMSIPSSISRPTQDIM